MRMSPDINRHRMKATYQRNLLVANVIVMGVICVAATALVIVERLDDAVAWGGQIYGSRRHDADSIVVREEHRAVRALPSLNPSGRRHDGFLGLVTLRTPEIEPPAVAVPASALGIANQPAMTDDTEIYTGDSLIIGTGAGDLLMEEEMMVYDTEVEIEPEDTTCKPTDLPVRVVHKVSPKVPPLAEWNEKEGYVEVLLLVDSAGKPGHFSCRNKDGDSGAAVVFELEAVLKNNDRARLQFYVNPHQNDLLYVSLEERPREYHFADYLLEVLPEWRFAPAIREGRPVASFVIIQYRFCLSGDPDCQEYLLTCQ